MENLENQERLEKVYQLLIEIARGNFSYRIERTNNKDELEALAALVNTVAEEIQVSFLHQGYINMHDAYMHMVQMIFLLDKESLIIHMNKDVHKLLNYEAQELDKEPLIKILNEDSIKRWDKQKRNLLSKDSVEKNVRLIFVTKGGLQLPAFCKVIALPKGAYPSARLMVISSDIIKNSSLLEKKLQLKILKKIRHPKSRIRNGQNKKSFLSLKDIENIRAIGTYLKHHPEKAISSLKELALSFGTNEFKLKKGFKELFGMTVFQFLKNERLKNAHISVRNSQEPFKRIAQQNGFKNASHFTREFKSRYGYTPRNLRDSS